MPELSLQVVVDRYNLIVTQPGSDFKAVYFKPPGQPYLVARDAPIGTPDFRTRAWVAATAKARELGWIV
jgi:hypothetical protein